MTKIDPPPIGDTDPIQPTLVAATADIKLIEADPKTLDASAKTLQMDGKLYEVVACEVGELVPVLKAAPGEGPHALHTRWLDGMPDPQSEIRWEAGDGWIDPSAEAK